MNWIIGFSYYLTKKIAKAFIEAILGVLAVFWVAGWFMFLPFLIIEESPNIIPLWLLIIIEVFYLVPMLLIIFGYLIGQYSEYQKEFKARNRNN